MDRRKNVLCTLLALILVLTSVVRAQSGIAPIDIERAGQSGWQFLKISGDARQAAMGGAYTAISRGDANAVFGNPAGLADVKHFDVQMNVVRWVADINHQSAAVAYNIDGAGVVGLSIAMLSYGDIPETKNEPLAAGGTTVLVTGNTFTAKDMAVGLSFAQKITENLSVGGNARWMKQQIAELSMDNWSLDFGTMYHTGFQSLRLAITARNFGPDSRFGGWSEEYQTESDNVRLPIDFRAGMAMDFFDDEGSPHFLTVVVEGDHPNDGREKFHFGACYSFEGTFFLRGGYKLNYDVQRFTFGGGINYSFEGVLATVNYAYVDFSELTQVHMFSLGFSF